MKETGACCGAKISPEKLERVHRSIETYRLIPGALIPVLHDIQDLFGYLPEDVLHLVSEGLNVPMAEIYGVASFYSFFSLEPKGEHVVRVCLGTACYVKGSQAILDKMSTELGVAVDKTTEDGKFTLEATRCLGACGLAPVMTVGEKVYGRLSQNEVRKILKGYR